MAEPKTSPPVSRRSRHKPKRRLRGIWKIVIAVAVLLLGTVIAYATHLAIKVDSVLDQIAPDTDNTVTDDVYGGNKGKGKADVEVKNILIFGTDNRPQFGSLNTDVIMLASLRPDTKSAIIVSVPRDTYMDPTGWRANKANSFYASARSYGKEGAYDMVREIFSEFFDVPIDYVIELDFKAFEDIVDAFGGVRVDVDIDMRYVDPTDGTNINLSKGIQNLSGKQALDFIRYRTSNRGTRESSDFERNARQQQVISALVGKMKSFQTVIRAGEVLDALGNHMKTTIPRDEIITMLRTYVGISSDDIEFLLLEGTWRSPYVWPNQESLDLIRKTLNDHMTIEQPEDNVSVK